MNDYELLAMLDKPHDSTFNYPTLDDYQRALDEIHAREDDPTSVLLCRDCCHIIEQGSLATCRSPQQPNYKNRVGAESFMLASIVRQFDCKGNWWGPR